MNKCVACRREGVDVDVDVELSCGVSIYNDICNCVSRDGRHLIDER